MGRGAASGRTAALAATLLAGLAGAACVSGPAVPLRPKVLVIGIDGLRPDQLAAARTPVLDGLAAGGRLALDATNCWTAEKAWNGHSATNWGTLLTGRMPSEHGATANGERGHRIGRDRPAEERIDSFLGMVKDAAPELRTAVVNTWAGIRDEDWTLLGQDTSVCDWWFHPPSDEDGAVRDRAGVEALAARLSANDDLVPDVTFLHIDGVDGAGHASGYGSAEYRAEIEHVDRLLAGLLDTVAARSTRVEERWLIIVTTDHGGQEYGTGHGDNADPFVHTIPFLVSADGEVLPLDGASLYDVAPTVLAWVGGDPTALGLRGVARVAAPARD